MSQKLSIKCPACAKILNFDASELENKKLITCKYCEWDFTLNPNLIITPKIPPQVNLTSPKPSQKVALSLQNPEEKTTINPSSKPKKSHSVNEQSLNKLLNPTHLKTKVSEPNQQQQKQDLFQDLQLPAHSNTITTNIFQSKWLILCVLALLGLYFQYVNYNLAKLAQNIEWRPSLTLWCKVMRCEVPPQVDLSRLILDYISVTSHPKFSDALKINLVIDNQAVFSQPFPKLKLDFSDSNHTIIAQRFFAPNEYLAGEAAGMQLIPAHTKVKVALEVLDPGKNTTNYHLTFSEHNL